MRISSRFGFFKLRQKERGDNLARQERRADVDPGVLVHLSAEEQCAIGALFPNDLRPLNPGSIVYQERPSLTRDDILGLVKT